jgi:3-phenylpropionate/cinnamic acid dioxygenase small subunit
MDAIDYFQIQNLIYRYADLLDRGDLDGVGALFEHAEVYMPGDTEPMSKPGQNRMTDMFRHWNQTYPETGGTLRTRHVTTNVIIEEDGPGFARTQAYFTVLQSTPDFALQPIAGGTYKDRFEKVDGAWRFCERREEMPLVGDLSRHLLHPYTGPR